LGDEMKKNVFDMGYDLHKCGVTKKFADLRKCNSYSIIEFYKVKNDDQDSWKKDTKRWFFRELTMSDEILNDVLPSNWQIMKYRGFRNLKEVKLWLKGIHDIPELAL
jgi:hypothetical protein